LTIVGERIVVCIAVEFLLSPCLQALVFQAVRQHKTLTEEDRQRCLVANGKIDDFAY
jgi:hypothetical protein